MFETADPAVFNWYVKTYGPEVNLFVDHSQTVQLECLRAGIWATNDTWGRIHRYRSGGERVTRSCSFLSWIDCQRSRSTASAASRGFRRAWRGKKYLDRCDDRRLSRCRGSRDIASAASSSTVRSRRVT
jgi:hypothetical protein